MNEPIFTDIVAAFADGELDREGRMRLLEQMASDPRLARQALASQKLKQAVARLLQEKSPPPPDALCRRIAQIINDADDASPPAPIVAPFSATSAVPVPPRPLQSIGRWMPAAVAAGLLIAALLTRVPPNTTASPDAGQPVTVVSSAEPFDPLRHVAYPDVLPVAQVDRFMNRHVHCLDKIEALRESTKFPTEIALLPDSIKDAIGSKPYPTLDLSALGYAFWQAGECSIPGSPAVHLMYKALPETGRRDSLSLWIVADEGQLHLQEGKTYLASPENAVHPIIVWRDRGMVYYLVGDARPLVEGAAQQLASGK